MAFGDRQQFTFRNFRGVDPRHSGLFPGGYVPQELVEEGLVLDALNLRFSRGRAYWHRNQHRIALPAGVSRAPIVCTLTAWARVSNVVTITTTETHRLTSGDKVTIAGATGINGTFTLTGTPTGKTATFSQTAGDASATGLTGTVTPHWTTICLPYVTEDYDQLLLATDLGELHMMNVDWSETPTQWAYGYELFAARSWVAQTGDPTVFPLPVNGIGGYAHAAGVLFLCAGAESAYPTGWPTSYWDGASLTVVGLTTPTTAATGAADATGTNYLVGGRYSYQVVYANSRYQSMPGPVVDVDVETATASGYVEPKVQTTEPNHGDTVTVDGIVYRFVTTTGLGTGEIQPYDIWISSTGLPGNITIFAALRNFIINGGTTTCVFTGGRTSQAYTPPHPTCTADWAYRDASGNVRVTIRARDEGTDGNSIALVESTSDARIHVSGAALSGGVGNCHIDLTSIPTGPTGTTERKLYRAYSADLNPGVRGTEFRYLATIPDNTTTSYADNTPQDETGEPVTFDHARPPRGSIMAHHRDRLWMAGVCRTSRSYDVARTIAAAPGGAVRAANVVTITVTVSHENAIKPGDWVVIANVTDTSFNGAYQIASVPSTTSFTYAQVASNATSGSGTVNYGMELSGLDNVLFYSEAGLPWYWPTLNRITVGSSSPIVALVPWHDQLVILKEDGAYLLTGYGESDWQLTPIPGAQGVIGPHYAASPFGILWAGHSGWELFDGQQVRQIVEYREFSSWTNETEDLSPPIEPDTESAQVAFPSVCWHDGRFYIMAGSQEYCYCWRPDGDTWEVRRLPAARIGLRAWNFSPWHSHIITIARWGNLTDGRRQLTVLDSLFRRDNPPNGNYGDSAGTTYDEHLAEVRLELPPVVAEPGTTINPLEVWVSGQWDLPETGGNYDADKDLHLWISTGADEAWVDLGAVTAGKKVDVPAGYATPRLRLALEGACVAQFALQAVSVLYQTRTARGA